MKQTKICAHKYFCSDKNYDPKAEETVKKKLTKHKHRHRHKYIHIVIVQLVDSKQNAPKLN